MNKFIKKALAATLLSILFTCTISTSTFAAGKSEIINIPTEALQTSSAYNVITLVLTQNTDILSIVQDALNTASENATDSKSYKVIIPNGDYKLSGTLFIYSNTTLVATGAHIYREFSAGPMLENSYGSTADLNSYKASKNITIDGGIWDGNCFDSVYGNGKAFCNIRIGRCTGFKLINASITNNKGYHHIELGGVDGIEISGCTFEGYTDGGNTGGKEAIQLDIIHSDSVFPGYEPFDDSLAINAKIENNTFTNVSRGIGSHTAVVGIYYSNIDICNNTFTNITDQAVFATNFKNCNISNNVMTNVGSGIDFKYMDENIFYNKTNLANTSKVVANSNCIINNNVIGLRDGCTLNTMFGVRISGGIVKDDNNPNNIPVGTYTVENATVSNNKIYGLANYGIRLNNANNSKLENNLIDLSTKDTSRVSRGISLSQSCSNTISNNTCKNITTEKSNGIQVEKNSNYNNFENNTIYNIAQNGISMLNSTGNLINGGTISYCNYHGIANSEGCVDTTICNVTIHNCSGNGISVYDADSAKISNNHIYQNNGRGINIALGTANIRNNALNNNNDYGISINSNSTANILSGNTLQDNKPDYAIAVYSNSTAPIISTNKIVLYPTQQDTPNIMSGKCNKNTKITATVNGEFIGTTTSNNYGEFKMKFVKPKSSTDILFSAIDSNGNKYTTIYKYILVE